MRKKYQKESKNGSQGGGLDAQQASIEALATAKICEKRLNMILGILGIDPTVVPTDQQSVLGLFETLHEQAWGNEPVTSEHVLWIGKVLLQVSPEHLIVFQNHTGEDNPWVILELAADKILQKVEASEGEKSTWGLQGLIREGTKNLRTSVYHLLARTHGHEQAVHLLPPPPMNDFHGGVLAALLAKNAKAEG